MRLSLYLVSLEKELLLLAEELAQSSNVPLVHLSAKAFLGDGARSGLGCLIFDTGHDPADAFAFLTKAALPGKVHIPVIVVANEPSIAFVVEAMQRGATTVLPRPITKEGLREEVAKACSLDEFRFPRRREIFEAQNKLRGLTPEEAKILSSIIAGNTNKEIATQLNMGLRTVEKRRNSISNKLAVDSVPAIVRLVMMSGATMPAIAPGNHEGLDMPTLEDRDEDPTDESLLSISPR